MVVLVTVSFFAASLGATTVFLAVGLTTDLATDLFAAFFGGVGLTGAGLAVGVGAGLDMTTGLTMTAAVSFLSKEYEIPMAKPRLAPKLPLTMAFRLRVNVALTLPSANQLVSGLTTSFHSWL